MSVGSKVKVYKSYTHVHEIVERRSVLDTQLVAAVFGDLNVNGIVPYCSSVTQRHGKRAIAFLAHPAHLRHRHTE